jgi:hypothetical protein
MTKLTLLTKAYNPGQIKQIESILNDAFEDLDVKLEILGSAVNRWVQVELSGEDEGIAKSYIAKEMGICPTSIGNIQDLSELKGYIMKPAKSQDALIVDFGIIEPKASYATIPLASLQAQLAEGKKVALQKIVELYGLCENLPIKIKVTNVSGGEGGMLAELSKGQVEKLISWQGSLLDRLIILRSPLSLIEKTLERTRLSRDIISVESLGLFEHVLTCKLGTDAAGLIPTVGRYFKSAQLVVFNPKKVLQFMADKALTL